MFAGFAGDLLYLAHFSEAGDKGVGVISGEEICEPYSVWRFERMPKKRPEDFEYLSNNPDVVPDPDIEEFMEEEIARAPKDTGQLAQRLRNNTAASPQDSGGDIDASWEDVNDSGE